MGKIMTFLVQDNNRIYDLASASLLPPRCLFNYLLYDLCWSPRISVWICFDCIVDLLIAGHLFVSQRSKIDS